MGLFEKKYCDICGEKIGLLGNRRLEDGNLCKDCARKLSPWFSDRRSSTVAEIRQQLEWRERNQERAAQFQTTRSFGERTKLLLDERHQWFAVTREMNPAVDNADVLDFSAITGSRIDIDEHRTELEFETKDRDGKSVRKSYNPPRYEYDYDFYLVISVNVPYFNEIRFRLNDNSVHIPFQSARMRRPGGTLFQDSCEEPLYDLRYRSFWESGNAICRLLEDIRSGAGNVQQAGMPLSYGQAPVNSHRMNDTGASPENAMYSNTVSTEGSMSGGIVPGSAIPGNASAQSWTCAYCGASNQGNFCECCGAKRT